jgi:hypothetical protein
MKHNFKLEFNPQIYIDIQQQVDYYRKETNSNTLGKRFAKAVKNEVFRLKNHALQYEVKYDDVRCLPIPKFPVRVHYRVNETENSVKVEAIIGTSESPDKWIK